MKNVSPEDDKIQLLHKAIKYLYFYSLRVSGTTADVLAPKERIMNSLHGVIKMLLKHFALFERITVQVPLY